MNTPQQHRSAPSALTSLKTRDPERLAEAWGIRLIETSSLDPRFNGMYLAQHHAIVLRTDLDYWTRRSCLAHELGHARYGDAHYANPRSEARADRFAADLLIDPDQYLQLEQLHDGHTGAIAHELGITPHLLQVWKASTENIIKSA